jgi:5'-3' exonuclease
MRNHNLIIDGNYFIYSRLFVLPRQKVPTAFAGPEEIDTRFMSTETEMGIFMRKLATDFASELRKVKNITGRIIFTQDSKSWRKDLFPASEYKANREQDSKINWSNVHKVVEEFTQFLKDKGVIIHRVSGAEGDDLIYAWTSALNSKGENCIIWSGDTDLMQLVNYNKSTDAYTLWYDNTRSRLAVYPGFQKYLDIKDGKEDDFDSIFDVDHVLLISNQIKEELKQFINSNNLEVNEIFCDDYVLTKILTGDKSDNIKSVYSVEKIGKTGKPRTSRINDEKARSIVNTFKKRHGRFSSMYLFEESYKTEILKLVASEMKLTSHEDLMSNLELNTNLILLHSSTIPETLQTIMFNHIDALLADEERIDVRNLLSKESILHGSIYIDGNTTSVKKTNTSTNLF